MEERNGHCLCGAITYTAMVKEQHVDACHCHMCVRQTSGPLLAVEVDGPIKIDDPSELSVYASSGWADRAFCSVCGTSIYWKMKDDSFVSLNAGTLDSLDGFAFTREIFIDEKPEFYDFAGDRPRMTGAEVMALFAAKDGAS